MIIVNLVNSRPGPGCTLGMLNRVTTNPETALLRCMLLGRGRTVFQCEAHMAIHISHLDQRQLIYKALHTSSALLIAHLHDQQLSTSSRLVLESTSNRLCLYTTLYELYCMRKPSQHCIASVTACIWHKLDVRNSEVAL